MKRNIPTHRYSSRGDTYRYSSLTSHSIATWRFDIAHMDFFYSPRGEGKFLRRNQMKLRKK